MAKSIGSLVLSDTQQQEGITWVNQYQWAVLAKTRKIGIGGASNFIENVRANRPIILTATEQTAWLSSATVQALVDMANATNTAYPFIWGDFSATVKFYRPNGEAIDLSPLTPGDAQGEYIGSIYLVTI